MQQELQEEQTVAEKDPYRLTRCLNIAGAALEYFITLMVGGVYLANLSTAIGLPDALTGVITAFVSLGLGFQFFAVFFANRTPVKRWTLMLHILNQTCFALLYFVPGLSVPREGKVAVFVVLLFAGQILLNLGYPSKMNWYMSTVADKERGRFTANKEIVSLLGAMVYTFLMGLLIDYYTEQGEQNTAFVLCGITLFILMILHTLTMVFAREKSVPRPAGGSVSPFALLRDRRFLAIVGVACLWNVAFYATTPFYGTYQNNELGFSMTFVAGLAAAYSIVRSLVSRSFGRLADRTSFAHMMTVCFVLEAVAFAVNMFTVPANGYFLFSLYYLLHALGMAGIESGILNLIYDYVAPEKRTGAMALQNTISGFAGFFTTLAISPLVAAIQNNGNHFLDMPLYAQQVVSGIGTIACLLLLLYLRVVVMKIPRPKSPTPDEASDAG